MFSFSSLWMFPVGHEKGVFIVSAVLSLNFGKRVEKIENYKCYFWHP